MRNILNFLLDVGKLKGKKRRGWLLHDIPKSESTAEHIFRMAILSWILGRKKNQLNLERILKIALIHDICEVHTKDETPYDPLLPKDKKGIKEVLKKWPRFTTGLKKKKTINKYKREARALNKLISKLPSDLKAEIKNLWIDFEKGLTPEGRFVKQADKAENFLQGIEYWKDYGKIQYKLWKRWSREIFDDPILIDFIHSIDKKFFRKKSRPK
jgi:putative hydrolase of HD superfamily